MSDRHNRDQHFGARMMLEVIGLKYSWPPSLIEQCWVRYLDRVRVERMTAVDEAMKLVRFSILSRAGRDRDWIRSWTRYGCPPVPDD